MPRRSRHYVPGFPYHIVQRGNNKQACFLTSADRSFYLDLWRRVSRRYGTQVHAYCLMTNHIHFLVTPQSGDSISRTMRDVGSRYAQHMNKIHHRTGTLWEGRHRSSLVQSERYLFTCYRYIELNPVRARMARHPGEYRWSSYALNSRGATGWLTPRKEYLRLGSKPAERGRTYREMFRQELKQEDLDFVRQATRYCQPIGDSRFREHIESRYGIDLGQMGPGRPAKQAESQLLKI